MKFTNLYIFLLILLSLDLKGEEKPMVLSEVLGGRKLVYEQKQMALVKIPFNVFENVYVDYPQLSANNKGVAFKLLNDFMRLKATEEVRKETFKYDFLPFAYEALASKLGKRNMQNWRGYSLETGMPTIHNIRTKILFFSGDILAYQVQYHFFFEPNSGDRVGGFCFVKTYYLQISTGKNVDFKLLFDPLKWASLQKQLNGELKKLYKANSAYLSSFVWAESEERQYEEEESEVAAPLPTFSLQAKDMQQMYINLSPISAEFVLPPFCSSFDQFNQLGIEIHLPISEFISYLPKQSLLEDLLRIGSSKSPMPYKGINILKAQKQNYLYLSSPLQNENVFTQQVEKGIKMQELFNLQMVNGDTQLSLVRRTSYDRNGNAVKISFGENERPESWMYFEYDSNNNLVNEIQYQYNEVKEQTAYSYNAQNCLIGYHKIMSESGFGDSRVQYFYIDSFVYEMTVRQIFTSIEELDNGNTKVYALDGYGNIVSSYPLSQSPTYISRYSNNKVLASYNLNYPNLDNYIYAYSKDGKLETIHSDNGRHLHTFTYKGNLLLNYSHYDSYHLEEMRDFFYDDKGNLSRFTEAGRQGNHGYEYVLKNYYFD